MLPRPFMYYLPTNAISIFNVLQPHSLESLKRMWISPNNSSNVYTLCKRSNITTNVPYWIFSIRNRHAQHSKFMLTSHSHNSLALRMGWMCDLDLQHWHMSVGTSNLDWCQEARICYTQIYFFNCKCYATICKVLHYIGYINVHIFCKVT